VSAGSNCNCKGSAASNSYTNGNNAQLNLVLMLHT